MKNLKALSMALLLSVGTVSLPVCAGDQPTTAVSANSDKQQETLKNMEKHLEYIASDIRFKNYLAVGCFCFSLVCSMIIAAGGQGRSRS